MIAGENVIKDLLRTGQLKILPLYNDTVRSNGLDLHVSDYYCRLVPRKNPLNLIDYDWKLYYTCYTEKRLQLRANSSYLLLTKEHVIMPENYIGLANLRSTWARAGLIIPPTVIDAGFKGRIVVEVRTGPFPVIIPAGSRFLHLVLARVVGARPYQGKYQGQNTIAFPRPDKEEV